ncbi:putative gustatory receptor 28b [Microplitis demolitor]|uniref:putative gustatory receptor 28b n=1 Tax=Microplitis demolitor TaxID=69319 RepID=UPI0004CCB38E|nr:putative gustatory receptor 28b [Microplitis demolitor]
MLEHLYPIIVLTTCVTIIDKQINKTSLIVHKLIPKYKCNMKIKNELKKFSLTLLHRKVQITAGGLFSLNTSLLTSLFGAAIIYTVILIELDNDK